MAHTNTTKNLVKKRVQPDSLPPIFFCNGSLCIHKSVLEFSELENHGVDYVVGEQTVNLSWGEWSLSYYFLDYKFRQLPITEPLLNELVTLSNGYEAHMKSLKSPTLITVETFI